MRSQTMNRRPLLLAAVASITAVGPATLNEFLAAETQATVTTVARKYADCCFVDKFHGWILVDNHSTTKNPAGAGFLKKSL